MTELEQRFAAGVQGLRRWLDEHSRLVIGSTTLLLALQWGGVIEIGLPDWWPLAGAVIIAAGIAGYFGAEKIAELIPDEDGVLLIQLDEQHDHGRGIHEIAEDDWEDLTVDGTLEPWDESPRRAYECVAYDPEENHAIANWRESAPSSELLGVETAEDALAQIESLRETLEPEAAKGKDLKRRLRAIAMRMDRERERASLELMDDIEIDGEADMPTVGEILADELPDDMHPHAGGGKDTDDEKPETQQNGHADDHEIEIEVDDDLPLQGL